MDHALRERLYRRPVRLDEIRRDARDRDAVGDRASKGVALREAASGRAEQLDAERGEPEPPALFRGQGERDGRREAVIGGVARGEAGSHARVPKVTIMSRGDSRDKGAHLRERARLRQVAGVVGHFRGPAYCTLSPCPTCCTLHLVAEWIFDVLPPSGARRGGDPAEHAFARSLDTFVREVVQNANDQRIQECAPEVHFDFEELTGEPLKAFCEKLSWPALVQHLRAAGHTQGGRAVGRFLADFERTGRLLILRIEDRHTVGLTGDESKGDSHFRALCKDTLYSHKRHAGAGGSYGLGKSVLWSFSGVSTVLFNSVLYELPEKKRSPRLIGRTELPSHEVDGAGFGGSGWFGMPTGGEGNRRAESIWSLAASVDARELHLQREELSTGTSILLVGFRDPTVDDEPSVATLHQRIRAAAVKWFWPAMELGSPGLRIETGGSPANAEDAAVRPFVEAWRARGSARLALEQPGDVVTRSIRITLPAERNGKVGLQGELKLIVQLAPEQSKHALTGHVAMFRQPGMVVKYWDRSALAQGMRPFHAILAGGAARDPGHVTDADEAVERFLRDAEPPGHDEWIATPGLKERWKPGYAKALGQLKDSVSHELRELLTPKPSHGARGPEALQKRFPFGRRGQSEAEPAVFGFSDVHATFDGERWSFAGSVGPLRRTHGSWEAKVTLIELGDGGGRLDPITISDLAAETAGAHTSVSDGVARVHADATLHRVSFRGTSAAVTRANGVVAEIVLEVAGRLTPEAS